MPKTYQEKGLTDFASEIVFHRGSGFMLVIVLNLTRVEGVCA